MLMEEAERIARDEHGSCKLAVISGKRREKPNTVSSSVTAIMSARVRFTAQHKLASFVNDHILKLWSMAEVVPGNSRLFQVCWEKGHLWRNWTWNKRLDVTKISVYVEMQQPWLQFLSDYWDVLKSDVSCPWFVLQVLEQGTTTERWATSWRDHTWWRTCTDPEWIKQGQWFYLKTQTHTLIFIRKLFTGLDSAFQASEEIIIGFFLTLSTSATFICCTHCSASPLHVLDKETVRARTEFTKVTLGIKASLTRLQTYGCGHGQSEFWNRTCLWRHMVFLAVQTGKASSCGICPSAHTLHATSSCPLRVFVPILVLV